MGKRIQSSIPIFDEVHEGLGCVAKAGLLEACLFRLDSPRKMHGSVIYSWMQYSSNSNFFASHTVRALIRGVHIVSLAVPNRSEELPLVNLLKTSPISLSDEYLLLYYSRLAR
jgi:hypothetical protein